MAIFHCSVRTISRSDNHSAVAAAAYRSGSILKDARTGQSHNYRNRKGIQNALIFLPQNAPEEYADRLTLWNAAESAEVRKNARVAREVILALPHELSDNERLSLTRDMALFLVENYGVAVDCAIHAPQEAQGDDPRNHHAHLLFTTREVKQDGLGAKTRILDDKEQGPQQIELIRQVWESLANAALQNAGLPDIRIDRRTLEDQGIDRIPQEHVGKVGTHAEDTEEQPRKEDDEDEDGKTDTGKSKAGSGNAAHTPIRARKATSSHSKKKYAHVPTRAKIRLRLNEDIKKLNVRRADFSPTPLDIQLKELDRHLERIDARVDALGTLSQKTSLPELLLALILALLNLAIALFAVRAKDEAARSHRAAERDTKAERQRARYGRTYRAHVSERMTDMRENIQALETRQKQIQKYIAFVALVERRVDAARPMLKIPSLPARTEWRVFAIPVAQRQKVIVEAIQVRGTVPLEYRPTIKQEPVTKNFKAELANGVSSVALNYSAASVLHTKQDHDTKRLEKPFTLAVLPTEDKKGRDIWHKEVTINIKSLDHIRSERIPVHLGGQMTSPKIWNIKANEKGKIILKGFQADIRNRKSGNVTANENGLTEKFNKPTKSATDEDVIKKVRFEAEIARAKIPEDLKAKTGALAPVFSNYVTIKLPDVTNAASSVKPVTPEIVPI